VCGDWARSRRTRTGWRKLSGCAAVRATAAVQQPQCHSHSNMLQTRDTNTTNTDASLELVVPVLNKHPRKSIEYAPRNELLVRWLARRPEILCTSGAFGSLPHAHGLLAICQAGTSAGSRVDPQSHDPKESTSPSKRHGAGRGLSLRCIVCPSDHRH
jgi:hypothetical protein